jgi:hypothetical protein
MSRGEYVQRRNLCSEKGCAIRCAMTFTRIRKINGRRYLYGEDRWREGGSVRSRSRYLGPLDVDNSRGKAKRRGGLIAFLNAQRLSSEDRLSATMASEAERVERYQRKVFGETAPERAQRERQEHLAKLHELYGLRLGPASPVPIEPRSSSPGVEKKEGPAEAGPPVETPEKSE